MEKFICAYDDYSNDILKIFTMDSTWGDYVEIHADVDLQLENCDYGVSGSPVWLEVSDYSISRIYINEGSYTLKEFKAKYSEVVVDEILGYISDAVNNVEIDYWN